MQATIPTLSAHPLDDVAAYMIWYRLSPDSLADILPYLTNPRRDVGGVMHFTLTQANVRRFTAEQGEQEGGPNSPVYEMLVSCGNLYRTIPAMREGVAGIVFEVCYESVNGGDGLLRIVGGNDALNSRG